MGKSVDRGLEEGEITLHLHPIVCNKTLRVGMYEALARLEGKGGEVYLPGDFIDCMKKSGSYGILTKNIINMGAKIAKKFGYIVAVNINYSDIEDEVTSNFIYNTVYELESYKGKLNFEITEEESAKNYNIVNRFIDRVKSSGSKICIDDFGAGYSNLSGILDLNIDYLKIDGGIISRLPGSVKRVALVKHVVEFTKELGIKTVAEYVSSEEIYNEVKELGIEFSQGFYFGKPFKIL